MTASLHASLALTPVNENTRDIAGAGEAEFGFDELFFSRTDASGLIQSGNSVFQRVAAYDWDELDGKPHKIVRHPDTPRAVFWALWDCIKQGRPIGAYVKNKAKDGRSYWVFAIVTPVEGGYLSVRLKPSSPLFAVVAQEYATLAGAERRDAIAPADSAALLMARLAELGFHDYRAFMAVALGAELAARDETLARTPDRIIGRFNELVTTAQSLLRQADIISAAYVSNENVPFNFRILAAQLGHEGAAIGIISSNYGQLSGEMKLILDQFVASAKGVFSTINDGYFLACTARVQRELLEFFRQEDDAEGRSNDHEMALLERQQHDFVEKAAEGLRQISRSADGLQQACTEMSRLVAGLGVTRIMGRVECARHEQVKDRTDELLSDLDLFQKTATAALKEIEQMNDLVRYETGVLIAGGGAW